MDLYKLKTFKAVASFLNFNQAATYLNCAQSTVSGQIKSLEDEMGEALFKRSKKRVQLTSAGEKMVGYANRLLAIEQEAIADIAGNAAPLGVITLRAPEAIIDSYFPSLLHQFSAQHPAVHFDISNCLQSSIENELQIDSVDLAFIFSDYLSSTNLITEKIFIETLMLVSGPEHPLADKAMVEASDLHAQTLLVLKTGCGYGLPFRQLMSTHIVQPVSVIEITSVEAIKKCVKNEMGLAILPACSIQKELENKELVRLKWINDLETSIIMVWHKNKRITPVLDDFMKLVRNLKPNSEILRKKCAPE